MTLRWKAKGGLDPRVHGVSCVTTRDRRTVRPAGCPAQAFQGKAGKAAGAGGGGEVSGIAQACADTGLPTEVWSAAKCLCFMS